MALRQVFNERVGGIGLAKGGILPETAGRIISGYGQYYIIGFNVALNLFSAIHVQYPRLLTFVLSSRQPAGNSNPRRNISAGNTTWKLKLFLRDPSRMVHRPSDSRLLVNLLSHEKDYSRQLSALLDQSQSCLASFSAYASASAPATSQIIIQVAGALAGADEGLRKYAGSLEQWQEQLRSLKELEDEVGNIVRDREIL